MPNEIEVSVDVPFMQLIRTDFPISFIVSVGFFAGVLACLLVRYLHMKYNDRNIKGKVKILNNIIEQKTKM